MALFLSFRYLHMSKGHEMVKGCTCRDLEEQSPLKIDSGTSLLVRPKIWMCLKIYPPHMALWIGNVITIRWIWAYSFYKCGNGLGNGLIFCWLSHVISISGKTSCCFLHIWCFFRTNFLRLRCLVSSPAKAGKLRWAMDRLRRCGNQQEWRI